MRVWDTLAMPCLYRVSRFVRRGGARGIKRKRLDLTLGNVITGAGHGFVMTAFSLRAAADLLVACSGPGAGRAIAEAESIGYLHGVVSAAIAVVSVVLQFRDWKRRAVAVGLAIALHPGWWVSARMGDCGEMRRVAAIFGTCAVLTLAIVPLRLPKRPRPVRSVLPEPLFDDAPLDGQWGDETEPFDTRQAIQATSNGVRKGLPPQKRRV